MVGAAASGAGWDVHEHPAPHGLVLHEIASPGAHPDGAPCTKTRADPARLESRGIAAQTRAALFCILDAL